MGFGVWLHSKRIRTSSEKVFNGFVINDFRKTNQSRIKINDRLNISVFYVEIYCSLENHDLLQLTFCGLALGAFPSNKYT